MASVAADTSAIAPPLPLPSRSDAAPSAGPSGAFADLLDAQTTPPPQGPGPAAPSAASNQGSPSTGTGAAPPKTSSGKDPSSNKDPKEKGDAAADNSGNGGSGVDAVAAAGLAIAQVPPDPVAVAADQSPIVSSDSQTGSPDPTALVKNDSAGQSSDASGENSPPDSVAGLAAMVPGVQTIVAASAIPPSTGTSSAPVTSLVAISVTSPANTLSGTSAPAAGLDWATIGATSSQQAGGTALSNASVAAASQDLLAASGAPSTIAGAIGTPEQNPTLNPALPFGIAPAANAANLSVLTGVASPLPLAPNTASPIDRTDQTPANAGAARETDPALIALPAQIKFAASARATDDSPSDSSPDAWLASAASSGDTTRNTSDQPGAIQPSFNPTILTAVQPTAGASAPPQHPAIIPDAVPLAGIPIAIAARVEAGEKRFEIRLDPPDLGRIEVTLNVDSSGRATSHLVVDRADTLDLLRRDAPALERALQSAGLTTGDGALQFSLRDQSFAGRDQGTPAPLPSAAPTPAESDLAPIDAAARRYGAMAGLGSGVDIRV